MRHREKKSSGVKVVAGTGGRRKFLVGRRKMVLAAVIALVLAGSVALVFATRRGKPQGNITEAKTICNEKQLDQVIEAIKPVDIAKLTPLVTDIQKQADYDKDPSCLYAVLVYQIHKPDPSAARATLNSLQKIKDFERAIRTDLLAEGGPAHNAQSLNTAVEFIELQGNGKSPNAVRID